MTRSRATTIAIVVAEPIRGWSNLQLPDTDVTDVDLYMEVDSVEDSIEETQVMAAGLNFFRLIPSLLTDEEEFDEATQECFDKANKNYNKCMKKATWPVCNKKLKDGDFWTLVKYDIEICDLTNAVKTFGANEWNCNIQRNITLKSA